MNKIPPRGGILLCSFAQIFLSEGKGNDFVKGIFTDFAFALCDVNLEVTTAEFCHNLTANPTRIAKIHRRSACGAADYCDCGKLALPLADRLEECGAFGTVGGSVGRAFYVAAAENPAVFTEQRRAHIEF